VILRRWLRWLLRLGLGLVAVVMLLMVSLPMGRYLLRAAWEESRILLRRRPITEMVADSAVPAPTRERLRLVLDARKFAVERLGLRAGESFTTYSRLDRDTLVLVLAAAYRDRLEAYRWWFPVVGRLPYKGFFDPAAAHRARDQFRQRGFDTYLRPSSAFSTLGWFNDPLLSTTLRADTLDLVNTVIHELTHNTIFVKSQAEFNESFASFVGTYGASEFFRSRGQARAAERVLLEARDDHELALFWSRLVRSVDSAYKPWPSDSAARVRARDTVFARGRRELVDSVAPRLSTIPAGRFARIQLDNASLLARRAYAGEPELFAAVFDRCGRDVRRSISAITGIARDAPRAFDALRSWVRDSSAACAT
jgi:predicted aminopeptidase